MADTEEKNPPLRLSPSLRKSIAQEMYRLSAESGKRHTFDAMIQIAWDAYECRAGASTARDPIPANCPICQTALLVTPTSVDIAGVPGEADSITIPAKLRDEVEEFLRFAVNPIVPDVEWRNMMLALFRERAAKRRADPK